MKDGHNTFISKQYFGNESKTQPTFKGLFIDKNTFFKKFNMPSIEDQKCHMLNTIIIYAIY